MSTPRKSGGISGKGGNNVNPKESALPTKNTNKLINNPNIPFMSFDLISMYRSAELYLQRNLFAKAFVEF